MVEEGEFIIGHFDPDDLEGSDIDEWERELEGFIELEEGEELVVTHREQQLEVKKIRR